ncbi:MULTISPECIES: ROK family protein [unclassified Arthrobacter]|uniref:ROK family protein n=1 Tax=unclassified Arthrobacter TaxID=235627 RepID=UPI0015E424C5|nr:MULTISPECIES: ROK family protein [unclassified Arthrobacter]
MSRTVMGESGVGPRVPVTSTQTVRDLNSSLVLDLFWKTPVDAGLTATELVENTGLTRSTVLAIADELREAGWLLEDRAPSLIPGRGRQARRFTFNRKRRLVVACDIGFRSITSVVADLKGAVLGRAGRRFEGREWTTDRTGEVLQTIDEALLDAGVGHDRIESACLGLAAPLDRNGVPFQGNPFWDAVRIDLERVRGFATAWGITFENDADLAAIAEMRASGGHSTGSTVTLLAGEWLGAGIVVNGELFRGANGGAGEMGYLERVMGVGSSLGPSAVARDLILEGLAAGRESRVERDARPSLESIMAAANEGDALAAEVVGRLEERLSLTVSTLSSFLDPGAVIISGGNAELLAPMLAGVRKRLGELIPHPPEILASTLGRDVVLLGAVHSAIAAVRGASLPS